MPMNQQNSPVTESDLIFAPEDDTYNKGNTPTTGWRILIVDDEPDIHDVTQMSLSSFEYAGRGLEFFNAYSAAEALKILEQTPDIAVALVDVVMETEHAGLDLIKTIRNEMKNEFIRLILRTGQPGQAPERRVIREYDINDYKEKTELTSQKLYSTIYTSLRSYRDLLALDNNRRGLEHVIQASGELFSQHKLNEFIQGVLQQLVALLYLGDDALYMGCEYLALEQEKGESEIIAATGRFESAIGKSSIDKLDPQVRELVIEAQQNKKSILRENEFVGYFAPHPGREDVVYINSLHPLSQKDLGMIELFLHNVSIAYENLILRNEIEGTQRDMLYMLGESIETRSRETGQHVRRVAEYCRLIALGMGLSEHESEIIEIASPLHDFGKIGIPDRILHKPGKLEADEWEVMKTHARIGSELLSTSKREILKAASIIAGQHHEHWNGNGYPLGLKGEEIHLYARIAAVADVFDALGSRRCYKDAWPVDKIIELLEQQKGEQFDPVIIDWVIEHLQSMNEVRDKFPDPDA